MTTCNDFSNCTWIRLVLYGPFFSKKNFFGILGTQIMIFCTKNSKKNFFFLEKNGPYRTSLISQVDIIYDCMTFDQLPFYRITTSTTLISRAEKNAANWETMPPNSNKSPNSDIDGLSLYQLEITCI